MLFNVPQYVDVEDKVAGPLTGKQLLWMFGMSAVLLILWTTLDKSGFFIAAVPVVLIFCALAFYKPNGLPLISYIIYGILYIFRPKAYTWQREPVIKKKRKRDAIITTREEEKKIDPRDISALAQTLDSDGYERNKRIDELIKRRTAKTKNKK